MQRHWYIYKKDHHLGPFTLQNLRELFQRNSISLNAQIWREGDPGWKALQDYDHLVDILKLDDEQFPAAAELWAKGEWQTVIESELPPALPPVPEDEDIEPPDLPELPVDDDELVDLEKDFLRVEENDEAHEENEVEQGSAQHTISTTESSFSTISDITTSFELPKPMAWYKRLLLVSLLLLIIIGPLVGGYYLSLDKGVKQLPFVVDSAVKDRLFRVINAAKRNEVMMVVMDQSGRKMWLISNIHYPADVELVFSSLDKKILSLKKVVFRAKTKLDNHVGLITKVVFEQGKQIVPGSYRVTLKGKRTGLAAKVLSVIFRQRWSKYLRVFYEPHLVFYSTTIAFIGHGTAKNFQQKLKEFLKKEHEKRIAPYKLWIQKFKTLSYTLGQFKILIKDHISTYRRRSDLHKYEQDYSTYIGGLIQNVVVEEQKNLKKMDDGNLFYFYQKKFVSLAIKSSKLGGEVVTALEKRKRRFHKRWKKAFISYFLQKITTLQTEVDKYSIELEELLLKAK